MESICRRWQVLFLCPKRSGYFYFSVNIRLDFLYEWLKAKNICYTSFVHTKKDIEQLAEKFIFLSEDIDCTWRSIQAAHYPWNDADEWLQWFQGNWDNRKDGSVKTGSITSSPDFEGCRNCADLSIGLNILSQEYEYFYHAVWKQHSQCFEQEIEI